MPNALSSTRCCIFAGTTLDKDVHVLLNKEFFADGQAYVALSRCRRLGQLHLWGLECEAIRADPRVAREYARLAKRPLSAHYVAHVAPRRATPALPHLSTIPELYTDE